MKRRGTYYSGYNEKAEKHLAAPTWYPALFALDQEIVPPAEERVTRYLLAHCGEGGRIMSVYYLLQAVVRPG